MRLFPLGRHDAEGPHCVGGSVGRRRRDLFRVAHHGAGESRARCPLGAQTQPGSRSRADGAGRHIPHRAVRLASRLLHRSRAATRGPRVSSRRGSRLRGPCRLVPAARLLCAHRALGRLLQPQELPPLRSSRLQCARSRALRDRWRLGQRARIPDPEFSFAPRRTEARSRRVRHARRCAPCASARASAPRQGARHPYPRRRRHTRSLRMDRRRRTRARNPAAADRTTSASPAA